MYVIHCHRCHRSHLVGTRSIRSLHNTSEGPIAYVDAPCGHLVIHSFRTEQSVPVSALDTAA